MLDLVSIRQHTSAYVSIRQQHVSILQHSVVTQDVSIRQHTAAYVSIRQHYGGDARRSRMHHANEPTPSAYVSIRQHTRVLESVQI